MPQPWGLGAFVGGLQEGYGFAQDSRRNRQREKIYDQAIEAGDYTLREKRAQRKAWGLPEVDPQNYGDDPFQSMMRKGWAGVKNFFGQEGQPQEGAPAEAASPQQGYDLGPQSVLDPNQLYGDGGKVRYANGGGVQPWQQMPMSPPSGMVGDPYRQGAGALPLTPPAVSSAGVMNYAGGGKVETPAEIAERLSKSRGASKSMDAEVKARAAQRGAEGPRQPAGRQTVEGDPSKYNPARKGQTGNAAKAGPPAPESAPAEATAKPGLKAKTAGFLKSVAAWPAAIAGMEGAYRSGQESTGQMADRIGVPQSALGNVSRPMPNMPSGYPVFPGLNIPSGVMQATADPSFWKDVGVRTAGTMQNVGNAALDMLPDSWRPDTGQEQPTPAAPVPTSPPNVAAAAPPRTNAASQASKSRSAGYPQPSPSAMGPQQQQDYVDPRTVDLQSIPNMEVQDWVGFRQKMRQAAAESGDISHIQAADAYVDDLQHRGFLHYGNMAMQFLQNGDEEGAAKSLMMAYQYFPNGTNLRFGSQGGRLVAVGIDAKTGQPKGAQVIDAKQLAMQLANFNNPDNFKTWTLDWRDQSLQEHKEGPGGREDQLAGSTMQYQSDIGRAALQNASAATTEANAKAAGAAGGGLKPDTIGSAEEMFLSMIDRELGLTSLENPEEGRVLAAVMSRIYSQSGGRLTPQQVVQMVLSEYKGMKGGAGGQ